MIRAYTLAQRLRTFAKDRGVTLRCLPEVPHPHRSPFDQRLGLDVRARTVLFTKHAPATGIIHEMGHLLFDPPYGPWSDEIRWFTWEFILARHFGVALQWRVENADYGTGIGDFGDLDAQEQARVLRTYWNDAQALRYLDVLPCDCETQL